MILSNLRVHTAFLTILLGFCCFVGQPATADTNSLSESVVRLLSGKITDFTGVARQIPEHQLPTALAAAKLLKFRALHGETKLNSNEAETFETILLDRMSAARQVAFSQNETCRSKVNSHEIEIDGQKRLVESKSNFSVFVFFRPDLPNGYWVPIPRYNWLWRAESERVADTWSEVTGAFFPPAYLNIESVKEVPLNNNEASELGFPKWNKYYDNKDGYPWKKM